MIVALSDGHVLPREMNFGAFRAKMQDQGKENYASHVQWVRYVDSRLPRQQMYLVKASNTPTHMRTMDIIASAEISDRQRKGNF